MRLADGRRKQSVGGHHPLEVLAELKARHIQHEVVTQLGPAGIEHAPGVLDAGVHRRELGGRARVDDADPLLGHAEVLDGVRGGGVRDREHRVGLLYEPRPGLVAGPDHRVPEVVVGEYEWDRVVQGHDGAHTGAASPRRPERVEGLL